MPSFLILMFYLSTQSCNICILNKACIYVFIIQHIVTLPKYGHGELNICRAHMTDTLRYT